MGDVVADKRAPRILLAEDELLVATDLVGMLLELGCEVAGPVATVAEVARLAGEEPLDCALLDVNLRGEPVFSAVPALQAREIPMVLSSGYHSPERLPQEFQRLPILVKPYDRAELAALLRAACGLPDLT
jgi:CheY-like chemotaxis protein